MDLAVWLRSLGLEQYEAAFRENAIDASVLPDFTDQDLEKLGVLLGHRRTTLECKAWEFRSAIRALEPRADHGVCLQLRVEHANRARTCRLLP
jgi:hypothetical protein